MNFDVLKNALAAQPLLGGGKTWRLAPNAWTFPPELRAQLDALGGAALAFYRALERLYLASAAGTRIVRNGDLRADWVAPLLNRGKPARLVAHQRSRVLAGTLPPVIRPDLLICGDGFALTEFDSVPGGIGLTAFLGALYGAGTHMAELFFKAVSRGNAAARVAVAVSDEATDYRPEFEYLAAELRSRGFKIDVCHPRELEIFPENPSGKGAPAAGTAGVFLRGARVDVVYRFFELFDLENFPAADALMRAAERGSVAVLPPMRAFQEEKISLALLHHPALFAYWTEALGEADFALLRALVPETWIVEPTEPRGLPASAVLLAPRVGGRPIREWSELARAPRRDRELVLKASGFDESAWGARSVTVGPDVSQSEWAAALAGALDSARERDVLFVLQRFRKPARLAHTIFDENGKAFPAFGRVRICPYYFVVPAEEENAGARRERVVLGGALCTFCPPDKKIIHGMRDAVLLPCVV